MGRRFVAMAQPFMGRRGVRSVDLGARLQRRLVWSSEIDLSLTKPLACQSFLGMPLCVRPAKPAKKRAVSARDCKSRQGRYLG